MKKLWPLGLTTGVILGTIWVNCFFTVSWQQEFVRFMEIYDHYPSLINEQRIWFFRLFMLRFFMLDLTWLCCFLPGGSFLLWVPYIILGFEIGGGISVFTIVYGVFGICYFLMSMGVQLVSYFGAFRFTQVAHELIRSKLPYLKLFILAHGLNLLGFLIEFFMQPLVIHYLIF